MVAIIECLCSNAEWLLSRLKLNFLCLLSLDTPIFLPKYSSTGCFFLYVLSSCGTLILIQLWQLIYFLYNYDLWVYQLYHLKCYFMAVEIIPHHKWKPSETSDLTILNLQQKEITLEQSIFIRDHWKKSNFRLSAIKRLKSLCAVISTLNFDEIYFFL